MAFEERVWARARIRKTESNSCWLIGDPWSQQLRNSYGLGHSSYKYRLPAYAARSIDMSQPLPIPRIPGDRILGSEISRDLEHRLCDVCGLKSKRFTPSLPVAFRLQSLKSILNEDYWVCEKSDGVRVVVFLTTSLTSHEQELYLVDRKNTFFRVDLRMSDEIDRLSNNLHDTVLDGELVYETSEEGVNKTKLLLFDCLAINNENVTKLPFQWRYACLQNQVLPIIEAFLRRHTDIHSTLGFEPLLKPMSRAYDVASILQKMPNLQHRTDGLIFTCLHSPYTFGSNFKILKWKPPGYVTIDFLLRFKQNMSEKSTCRNTMDKMIEKPSLELHLRTNDNSHVYFDDIAIDDDEWTRWKQCGTCLDGRIVECAPIFVTSCTGEIRENWKIIRLREDKIVANHYSIITRTLESIHHGVSESKLVKSVPGIARNWFHPKRRAKRIRFESTMPSILPSK